MSADRAGARLPHIPALDGLRGIGVLGILLFHGGYLRGGWLGVDLFFVLSGFLITSLLLAEYESAGRISLLQFWGRRARRLIPALLLALFGVVAYTALFAEPEEFSRIRADGIATLFYVANWQAILAGHDYWAMFQAPSPLDHAWSLSIEEQFYLFWPPLAYLILRRAHGSTRNVVGVAALLALCSACWMAWLFDEREGTARVYFGTDTRAAATLIGAALAGVVRPRMRAWPQESNHTADVAAWLAGLALLFAWGTLDGTNPLVYRGGLLLLSVFAAVIVAGVVFAPDGWVARSLEAGPLRFLGAISYGAYLWHWPLYLVLTPERVGQSGLSLLALRITATLVVASLSYFVVERPIRRGALSVNATAALGIAASALAITALVAVTAEPDGPPAMVEAEVAQQLDRLGPHSARPDLLLIGDSVAEILGSSLKAEGKSRGLDLLVQGNLGCTLLASNRIRFGSGRYLEVPKCPAARSLWHQTVAEQRPRVVLIIEGGTGIGDRELDTGYHHPCEEAYDIAFERSLTDAVEIFEGHGAISVIATTSPPDLQGGATKFLKLWGDRSIDEIVPVLDERMGCQNSVRQRVTDHSSAHLIDLNGFVCPQGVCQRYIGDVLLRPDGVHFKGDGAALVASWILDELKRMGVLEDSDL